MPLDFTDDKSTKGSGNGLLLSVRQQAITWTNFDPDLCRHTTPLGHKELINEVPWDII